MKRNLKALGMVLVLGGTLMFTGCSSTETPQSSTEENKPQVEENVVNEEQKEELRKTLSDGIGKYVDYMDTCNNMNYEDGADMAKAYSNVSKEVSETVDIFNVYVKRDLWEKGTTEYEALETVGGALTNLQTALDKAILYGNSGSDRYYEEFKEALIASKECYDKFKDNYASKLNVEVKGFQKVEEKEEKQPKKESKKKVEKGQCYDCGEYYPVSQMTFNGRSYHCGCANKYCEQCKKEIPYGEEIVMGDNCYLCEYCYNNTSCQ